MAVKKPLAVYNGKLKELQPGDTIEGAVAIVKIKQTMVDFAKDGKPYQVFDIFDSECVPSSLVVASLAYNGGDDPTDEWWKSNLIIRCGNANYGVFSMFISSANESPVSGIFYVNYIISAGVDG